MSDPIDEIVGGLVCTVFGAGVAWGMLQSKVKTALSVAASAAETAANTAHLLNIEKERSTKQQGEINLCNERLQYARRDVDELRAAVFKSRLDSDRGMPAVRLPLAPSRDERREPSDNPPPHRPRLPSVRDR